MKIIESLSNEAVKEVVRLHLSKGRAELGAFFVEGKRACITFIKNGYKPLSAFVTQEHVSSLQEYVSEDIIAEVSDAVIKKMSASITPSGILCVFALPKNPDLRSLSSGLVLADITDPGNMGTLIRSCAAFGYNSVIVIGGCDPFSPKALQASAGTLPLISLFEWTWEELTMHKGKLTLAALVVNNGIPLKNLPAQDILFVVGNEAHGLPEKWVNECDHKVTLEMSAQVESLNAGIAGTLALALFKHQS